jgi:hypothetical protein
LEALKVRNKEGNGPYERCSDYDDNHYGQNGNQHPHTSHAPISRLAAANYLGQAIQELLFAAQIHVSWLLARISSL